MLMVYENSDLNRNIEELNKKVEKIEKYLCKLAEFLEKLDAEKIGKNVKYNLAMYESKIKDEDKADKIIKTFLQGRFQTCEICGRFKFIENLTDNHAICEKCLQKYIAHGTTIEQAKALEKK